MRLAGKVAIVTGGSRGIGRAIAEGFAREGASVAICGRSQDTLAEVAREIGHGVLPVACHVGRAEQIAALVERVTGEFGRIDVLVNNAGTNVAQGPCFDIGDAQFDKMIEINLKSAFRLIQAVAPGMCARGAGLDYQYCVDFRASSADAWIALQHDEGCADYDDSVVRSGTGTERGSGERDCSRFD